MCFEQSHHKWLLETHVASRYEGAVPLQNLCHGLASSAWFLTTTEDTNLWHKSVTHDRISTRHRAAQTKQSGPEHLRIRDCFFRFFDEFSIAILI